MNSIDTILAAHRTELEKEHRAMVTLQTSIADIASRECLDAEAVQDKAADLVQMADRLRAAAVRVEQTERTIAALESVATA